MKNRAETRRVAPAHTSWIGGVLPTPFTVGNEREAYRPRIALWVEQPSGLILAQDILPPEVDAEAALAEILRSAFSSPLAGAARRPARIRVADATLAAAIRSAAGGIPIEIAPTPQLDEVIAALADAMRHGVDESESYLEGGRVGAAAVAGLFAAAQRLYEVAPWMQNEGNHVLRVDIPALDVEGACVCTIGAFGESVGLLIFPSRDACDAFQAAASRERGAVRDIGTTLLSLEFLRGADLPASMRREVSAHHWPVASRNAYPRVCSRDRDGMPLPLSAREIAVASACASTLAGFYARHRDLLAADEINEPVSETWSDPAIGFDVRITLPYEAFPLFEETPDPAHAPAAARPSSAVPPTRPPAGRNDPCPCGSGKKYKKCHLREDELAHAPARDRASAHDLDNWLSEELFTFAMKRLGEEWRASASAFEDAEQAVQLALPWALYDFRVGGRTAADWYLDQRGSQLQPAERAWIGAQQRAWLSVWEIEEVEPGVGVTLRDLLTLETRRVHEVLGSRTLVRRDAVLGRVVDTDGVSLICGMHPRVLSPGDAAVVIESARRRLRRKGVVPVERLRDDAIGRHLIERWEKQVAVREQLAAQAPALRNTSGDPFLTTVDHFALEDGARDAVSSRLAALDRVEEATLGNGSREYVFLAPRKRGARTGRTVLGTAQLSERALRIETTSRKRADAVRSRVEDACAGLLRHRAREHADPLSERAAGAGNLEPTAVAPPPPEVQQALFEWKRRYYADWLDERIPALGGQTPRQAARTKEGRARLDLLLRDLENFEQRAQGDTAFDFGSLRRELGIA